ncbi:MAG: helix-turn-helix domain-containing protein [Oscillospiraceae bacterium]|nr:helix-turn-helix domain-containing protein [Oscillospiraceae bacterium]
MKWIPFSIIKAAKEFDTEAVEAVFRHFEGYIASQCVCYYTDEQGNTRSYVDEDLRYQAKIALFNAIAGYQFKEPPNDFMA